MFGVVIILVIHIISSYKIEYANTALTRDVNYRNMSFPQTARLQIKVICPFKHAHKNCLRTLFACWTNQVLFPMPPWRVEVPVHRNVLSVRSPVQAFMYSSKMQKGLGSAINVTAIQSEVLKSTLRCSPLSREARQTTWPTHWRLTCCFKL